LNKGEAPATTVKLPHQGNGFDWYSKIILETEKQKLENAERLGILPLDLEDLLLERDDKEAATNELKV
jgi:hypothetical protein